MFKVRVMVSVCFCAVFSYTAINAMFLQDGVHPAPFSRVVGEPRHKAVPGRVTARVRDPGRVRHTAVAKPRPRPKIRSRDIFDKAALKTRLERPLTTTQRSTSVTPGLSPGSDPSKATIRLVQIGLAELGYNPGPLDGSLGAQTRTAIRQFESHRRLPVTGAVSPQLIRELRKVTGTSVLSVL